MWFPMRTERPGYVGLWTFQSVNVLPNLTVSEVFAILLNDSAWQYWHPEVTDIKWSGDYRGVGAARCVVIRDWPWLVKIAGPFILQENFDVWEDTTNLKMFGFGVSASTRPVYRVLREEFKVETFGEGSKFTRSITIDPSFLLRYVFGFMVKPLLSSLFEQKCPQRFEAKFGTKCSIKQS